MFTASSRQNSGCSVIRRPYPRRLAPASTGHSRVGCAFLPGGRSVTGHGLSADSGLTMNRRNDVRDVGDRGGLTASRPPSGRAAGLGSDYNGLCAFDGDMFPGGPQWPRVEVSRI